MKQIIKLIMVITIVTVISGCGNSDDTTQVSAYFFADLPTTASEDIKPIIIEALGNGVGKDVQVQSLPMHFEKIYVELAGNNGDIYFLKQDSFEGIIDPIGFSPLDGLVENEDALGDEFKDIHPNTGESHVYVVPISNDSLLMEKLGLQLDPPLAAFVPKFSDNKEEMLALLQALMKE